MEHTLLYRHQNYSQQSLSNLSQIIGSSQVEIHFDHLRISNDNKEKHPPHYGYGQLRMSAPVTMNDNQVIIVLNMLIPAFHTITTDAEASPEVTISADYYPVNEFRQSYFTIVGNTILPAVAAAVKQISLVHSTANYVDQEAQLEDVKARGPRIKGELPETINGTRESFDVLSFIAIEYGNDEYVIIEILDSPNSYQVHFNDAERWRYMKESIDEDTGLPQFTVKHVIKTVR